MKKLISIKTKEKIRHCNAKPSTVYKVQKVTNGYIVGSKRFGLFIDQRDVAK